MRECFFNNGASNGQVRNQKNLWGGMEEGDTRERMCVLDGNKEAS